MEKRMQYFLYLYYTLTATSEAGQVKAKVHFASLRKWNIEESTISFKKSSNTLEKYRSHLTYLLHTLWALLVVRMDTSSFTFYRQKLHCQTSFLTSLSTQVKQPRSQAREIAVTSLTPAGGGGGGTKKSFKRGGSLGLITSRCSGKEPALLPRMDADQTRESGGNRAYSVPRSNALPFYILFFFSEKTPLSYTFYWTKATLSYTFSLARLMNIKSLKQEVLLSIVIFFT